VFKSLFSLSYTQVGIITGGGLVLTLIAQLQIGRISDGKNFALLLTIGLLFLGISMLFIAQSKNFLSLAVFILLLRFASSFFHPIGVGWISRIFKKNRLDWAMGIQSGCADIGAFIAVSTTLYLTEISSWSMPLYIWSILAACGVLSGILMTNNMKSEYLYVKKEKNKQSIKEAVYEGIHLIKKIKPLVPAFIISGSAWGVTITYLPLLLQERTTISLSLIGILVAVWIGVGSIASFSYGKIVSIFNRKKLILWCYLTMGLMGFFLTYFTHILLLCCILLILGIATFLTYPILFVYVSEATHESVEGRTFGLTFTLQLGGGTTLLFVGGILSDIFGIVVPFVLLGSFSFLVASILIINYTKPLVNSS
jgi:FSR family fosmidomycin resistance protein-like MFS transporter